MKLVTFPFKLLKQNYRFSTYDSHSELCDAMTLVKGVGKPGWGYFLRAESFYNVATAEDQYSREIGGGGTPQSVNDTPSS